MQVNPVAYAVQCVFAPDYRHGPNGGCPFCGIQWGHLEGCTSPNAATSKLPVWPRMKQHVMLGDKGKCDRCGATEEFLVDRETRPIYGDLTIRECERVIITTEINDPMKW